MHTTETVERDLGIIDRAIGNDTAAIAAFWRLVDAMQSSPASTVSTAAVEFVQARDAANAVLIGELRETIRRGYEPANGGF